MATNFFQRWSSRKLAVREELSDSHTADIVADDRQAKSQQLDLNEQNHSYGIESVPTGLDGKPELDAIAEPEGSGEEPTLTLKDVANVTFETGVTSFMKTGVEKSVKKAALRKLFHSDEFNYVSDMDDHTEDFSNVPTLDSNVTKQLRSWVNQAVEKIEEVADTLDQTASGGTCEDLAGMNSPITEALPVENSEQRASIYTSAQDNESDSAQGAQLDNEAAFDANNAKLDGLSETS